MTTLEANVDAKIVLVVEEHAPEREQVVAFGRRLGSIAIPAGDRRSGAVIARAQPGLIAEHLLGWAGIDAVVPAASALIELEAPIRRLLRRVA